MSASTDSTTSIEVIERPGLAIPNPKRMVAQAKEFAALKRRLLTKEDYVQVSGTWIIKRSGWRKLAAIFGLSDEIVYEHRQELSGGGFSWEIRVRMIAPNGRFVEAVGSCSSTERKYAHPDHDVRSVAHTRAKSRATSDMLGGTDQVADDSSEQEAPAHEALEFESALLLWQRAKENIEEKLGENAYADSFIAWIIVCRGDIREAYRHWRGA